jgi:rubrerythrin
MPILDLPKLERLLKSMVDVELAVARLYSACARRWPYEAAFWEGLAREEETHATRIQQLGSLVSKSPDDFEMGSSFPLNEAAIDLVVKYVNNATDQVEKGEMSREKLITLARDLENSLVEKEYAKMLKSRNKQFSDILAAIHKDTERHRNLLEKKLSSL